MRRNNTLTRLAVLFCLILVLFSNAVNAHAASTKFGTYSFAVKVIARTTGSKNINTYSDSSLSRRIGYIYPTDNVELLYVKNTVAKVRYPDANNKPKVGWIKTKEIMYWDICGGALWAEVANQKITTYSRDDLKQQFGYISKGDKFYVIGGSSRDNRIEYVLYPVNTGYKLGWIRSGSSRKGNKIILPKNGAWVLNMGFLFK